MSHELYWLSLTLAMTALFWAPYVLNRVAARGIIGTMANPSPGDAPLAPFAELGANDIESAWRVSVARAVGAVQAAAPGMLARGRGTILFSGATGSLRGASRCAAFACAKFALRGLAQSLAREYQSQGVHAAHVVIDRVLRGSPSVDLFGKESESTIEPQEAARAYRWLAEQPRSARTHEIDLRPYTERF